MTRPTPHLDGGAVIRLLDGEPLPGDDARHLAACPECRARRDELLTRSEGLAGLLAGARPAEPTPPLDLWDRIRAAAETADAGGGSPSRSTARARRDRLRPGPGWSRPLGRAAAVAGILLAGALAAEPVRDWITAGIERIVDALASGPGGPPASSAAAGGAGTVVSFVPAGDRVTIRIDEAQPAGTVEVVFEERDDAAGEVVGPSGEAELLVLPDGFRARNAGGRDWSYRFRMPATLARVSITVAGVVVAELTPADGRTVLEVRASP